jgi:hypothetical protein
MCTVTYLPTPEGFVLTHNRDEAPSRSPKHIDCATNGADRLIFPRDTRAGGTWIAAARSGKLACVLNGAFLKHRHEPPYRRSRGLLLLDFFHYSDPENFFREYPLDGIEPFTFLLFGSGGTAEWRWDGTERHLSRFPDDEPAFWCSATLYPPEMQVQREAVFTNWLQRLPQLSNHPTIRPSGQHQLAAAAMHLHRTGSVGDPANDFVMNRDGRVQTVSITQVVFRSGMFRMQYLDLLDGGLDRRSVRVRS